MRSYFSWLALCAFSTALIIGCDPDCTIDADCNDDEFCNGAEVCGIDGACHAGEEPCGSGQECDERANMCVTDCTLDGDEDGDGFNSIRCGGTDCDDEDAQRGPSRTEICDNEDKDEDCNALTFGHRDVDGDGYGDARCVNLGRDGEVASRGTDCDDMRSGVHPDLLEACNDLDDDCDTAIDEGVLVGAYTDEDGDGYGTGELEMICAGTQGYAGIGGDCDDALSQVHPGAFRCVSGATIEFCQADESWSEDRCPGGGLCVPQPDGTGVCLPGEEYPECGDGSDNDDDGAIDWSDPHCSSPLDNSEAELPCDDGLDNDGDLAIDFPADPGCSSFEDGDEADPPAPPACGNGLDDDNDGTLDYLDATGDPGCTSSADDSEREASGPQCDNGLDDDDDTDVDYPDDKTCQSRSQLSEAAAACQNGTDDDRDGLTDYPSDPGCLSSIDDNERGSGPNAAACDNQLDDDEDGASDFPGDVGCTSPQDASEM